MKKRIPLLIPLFIFGLLMFLSFQYVQAAVGQLGWLWGGSTDSSGNTAGVGWVSMDAATDGAGGADYGVTIPVIDGPVTGYAWSSNLGWIDFNTQDHCTTGVPNAAQQQYEAKSCTNPDGTLAGVYRESDELKGWMRYVSIAEATAVDNSGGWDGWVKLGAAPALGYEVTIDPGSGQLSGYAWSSELGALSFNEVVAEATPVAPTITLSASPVQIPLNAGQTIGNTNPKTDITWKVTGQNIASCVSTCSSGTCAGWTDKVWASLDKNSNEGIATNVSIPDASVTFTLTCTDANTLVGSNGVPVNVGCQVKECGGTGGETCVFNPTDIGSFVVTGDYDNTPGCKEGCKSDDECKLREGSNWREVAP